MNIDSVIDKTKDIAYKAGYKEGRMDGLMDALNVMIKNGIVVDKIIEHLKKERSEIDKI